jgi:subtilisin-like proprotein convertase family protein
MKPLTLLMTLMLGWCASSHGALYTFTGSTPNGGVIPDGNLSGWNSTLAVSGLSGSVGEVRVNLNISGGYNGDLYAYLSFNGTLVPLLTRVGTGGGDDFGFDTSGMTVMLADSGLINIHDIANPDVNGTYQPDGQVLDPGTLLPGGISSTPTFASFNGMNPNGNWTIFFADLSGGDQSTITGWSLDIITAVPEPVNVALGIFAGLFLAGSVCRSERVRNLFGKLAPVKADATNAERGARNAELI